MFWKLSTQWYVSMAGLTGINYKSLEYLCKIYTVKDSVAMFEGNTGNGIRSLEINAEG